MSIFDRIVGWFSRQPTRKKKQREEEKFAFPILLPRSIWATFNDGSTVRVGGGWYDGPDLVLYNDRCDAFIDMLGTAANKHLFERLTDATRQQVIDELATALDTMVWSSRRVMR